MFEPMLYLLIFQPVSQSLWYWLIWSGSRNTLWPKYLYNYVTFDRKSTNCTAIIRFLQWCNPRQRPGEELYASVQVLCASSIVSLSHHQNILKWWTILRQASPINISRIIPTKILRSSFGTNKFLGFLFPENDNVKHANNNLVLDHMGQFNLKKI